MAAKPAFATDLAWACQILAAAQFFLTGLDKLAGAPPMIQLFETVGFGQWFRYFTGGVEVIGATLLLMPPHAVIGASLLAVTMIGALVAHLTVLPFPPVRVLVLLAMVGVVLWVRRREP